MNTQVNDGRNAESSRTCEVTCPLILDLIGPFVVHLCDGKARIYGPKCPDHHANILTDTNDIQLVGSLDAPPSKEHHAKEGYEYGFRRDNAPARAETYRYLERKQLLVVSRGMDSTQADCHFVFEAPYPDSITHLLPAQIWAHPSTSETLFCDPDCKTTGIVNSLRARGIRFFYKTCVGQPEIEGRKPKSALLSTKEPAFDALTLGFEPPHYRMTLRFDSLNANTDEHNADAYSCFQNMRCLVPGASEWRVDFDDSSTGGIRIHNHSTTHPVYCGSVALIVDPTQ